MPATAPGAVLLPREQKPSSSSEGAEGEDRGRDGRDRDDRGREDRDNPFAAPPAGTPDQEWRPRHAHSGQHGDDAEGSSGEHDAGTGWGSQWSSRQPGRQSGGFGSRPGRGGPEGPNGTGGPGGPGQTGLRWDPTDPAQRRARYALLSGMWAFFFALFSLPELALLLGALALYWGISSLRAKPRAAKQGTGRPGRAKATAADVAGGGPPHVSTTPTAGPPHATAGNTGTPPAVYGGGRPQTTAALSGLVTACLALAIVAAGFTLQLVYKDYFTCVNDALTQSARHSCEKLLPEQLRPILSVQE